MEIILVWILNAVALLVVAYILPGITVASFGSALIAALVLGLLNTLVKPILILLTLPITIVTLGLFLLVLNALVFWFAGSVLKRSDEHTSELQALMRISYAGFYVK